MTRARPLVSWAGDALRCIPTRVLEEAGGMTVGEIIATGRKRARLTQKEVAARIVKDDGVPISQPYLNDIEHDRRGASPSPQLLKQFADALHLSYDYLLFTAGQLPDDLRSESYTPEEVEAAFQAFRRTLSERSTHREP